MPLKATPGPVNPAGNRSLEPLPMKFESSSPGNAPSRSRVERRRHGYRPRVDVVPSPFGRGLSPVSHTRFPPSAHRSRRALLTGIPHMPPPTLIFYHQNVLSGARNPPPPPSTHLILASSLQASWYAVLSLSSRSNGFSLAIWKAETLNLFNPHELACGPPRPIRVYHLVEPLTDTL